MLGGVNCGKVSAGCISFRTEHAQVSIAYLQGEKHGVGSPLHPIRVYLVLLHRTCQHAKASVHNLKSYLQALACHIAGHSAVCSCCYTLPVPARCEAVDTVHLCITVSPLLMGILHALMPRGNANSSKIGGSHLVQLLGCCQVLLEESVNDGTHFS